VDIPVEVAVHPVREAVRALIVDDGARALLVRFADDETGASWWCPPGGGLEPGEDHLAAVRRELREELGRDDLAIGPWIGWRIHTFWWQGWMTQRERWVLCRTRPFPIDARQVASLRLENIRQMRWWSARELRSSGVSTAPRGLARLLDALSDGRLPDAHTDLGV
jgi:8-oxo-dGTP pyrophosphatase MutT (NUDIX family)